MKMRAPSAWPEPKPRVDYGNAEEFLRILNEYILDEKGESEVKKMWEFKRERIGNCGGEGGDEIVWRDDEVGT